MVFWVLLVMITHLILTQVCGNLVWKGIRCILKLEQEYSKSLFIVNYTFGALGLCGLQNVIPEELGNAETAFCVIGLAVICGALGLIVAGIAISFRRHDPRWR